MDVTPTLSLFDDAYKSGTAPWVIGEPQPAIVNLERSGLIRGTVLDVGCGAGEHTILLTGLGYDVLGVDYAPSAVDHARRNAEAKGVDARFEVADAMDLGKATYDTIVDSALFHIFDETDRARYVASLRAACRPGGVVHVLALSDRGRGFGPQVSESDIRDAFGDGWLLESLGETTYRGVVQPAQADAIGLAAGSLVDEPAWLARIRRRPF
ncbi:class I SAM-dependent methyltransferase [Mycolicibacterium novocastrense]|uniref:Class I SAM-dependent methyltransferase n=1 Tax=Mycolicibacterium novocastrense TaxID=59813 RepID=A0AAW5SKG5_MYCNV|nr:class I SAM-dependent methyltransferase [Mycolicibacterium novocastrense]MCV7023709.1 class I SAM-dependent methyltransferase [Mycolicibacterium novocastrense]GAT07431.1 methyltransferase family protein [Mycolicibacterium novocastrense]